MRGERGRGIMRKYTIDYGYGIAYFYTKQQVPELVMKEFYKAAYNCFGIRKSICGSPSIESVEVTPLPAWMNTENVTHVLMHNGDEIIFNANQVDEQGEWIKLKSEWD
jgi:hypothetical protein